MTSTPDDAHSGGSAPAGQGRTASGPPPSPTQARGRRAAEPPDSSATAENARFDSLDEVLAPSTQGRRGPLTIHARIIWVDRHAGQALSKTQGRVLRDLLVALTARQPRTDKDDEEEASP